MTLGIQRLIFKQSATLFVPLEDRMAGVAVEEEDGAGFSNRRGNWEVQTRIFISLMILEMISDGPYCALSSAWKKT